MKNKEIAQEVLTYVGGAQNVKNVYHCATRLRFTLNHSDTVDVEKIKKIKGVINVLGEGTQIQVVIGNAVDKVYDELTPLLPDMKESNETSKEKGKLLDRIFNVISGIFAPYLPLLMCSGILTGLLTLATSMKWLDAKSGTYAILAAAGSALFYFFPILLSYTAAKQFKTNPFVAVVIGAVLIHPTFTALAGVKGAVTFLGIPVVMASYSSSVIPAIIGVWFYSVIDHQLSKIIPDSIRSLVITLVGLVVVVPITILVFGPFGTYLSKFLGDALNGLVKFNPLISGIIGGGLCGYMAVFGLQWGVIPIIIINIANLGYDYFTPMWMMGPYAQVGIALAVFLKTKDTELKQLSLTGFLTGLFTGITEPIIYGLLTKYKKLHIPFIVGGAVGGGFVGAMHVKVMAFLFAGILNFPGYFGGTFIYYIIGMILAIGIAAVMTYIIGFEDNDEEVKNVNAKLEAMDAISPVEGELISLSQVKDEAFASKSLGDGVAIIPSEGKVYAPVTGKMSVVYPTGHAYGITGSNGVEILIHLGIDTVDLQGRGFKTKVKQNQFVKKGELIGEFDLSLLKKENYDPTVMLIVTNKQNLSMSKLLTEGFVKKSDTILSFK